ncbi:hypothetical protein [Roseimarinus sediminis]|uniref:hypothetical protein n=1 Tax=Roseimarinus sediminis TaxID=1610899 RepID=UPI003D24B397
MVTIYPAKVALKTKVIVVWPAKVEDVQGILCQKGFGALHLGLFGFADGYKHWRCAAPGCYFGEMVLRKILRPKALKQQRGAQPCVINCVSRKALKGRKQMIKSLVNISLG